MPVITALYADIHKSSGKLYCSLSINKKAYRKMGTDYRDRTWGKTKTKRGSV